MFSLFLSYVYEKNIDSSDGERKNRVNGANAPLSYDLIENKICYTFLFPYVYDNKDTMKVSIMSGASRLDAGRVAE
jgi:hypothetical protein